LVLGHARGLRRLVANVLDNAIKYGGKARVALSARGRWLLVVVDDDGPGIPAEQREAVLEPFVRLDPSRNRATGGAGLGLTIAKKVVDTHHGRLVLSDVPEGGARVLIALPGLNRADLGRLLERLSPLASDISLVQPDLAANVPVRGVQQVGRMTMLDVQRRPISEYGVLLKAIEDYGLGLLACLVFAPVMALCALAIKLDSPGPVFFRQRRHGHDHRIITVWKFRTMKVMEDGDTIRQATRDDDRVTRIGHFLRKTSLDELPQLFNVLRGEMSLVGPRPHAIAHNVMYTRMLERYANRHRVKPGITGWAQIHGFRGPTEDPDLMRQRVELDLYYIENWSIWLDVKILMATPFLGFIGKNAL